MPNSLWLTPSIVALIVCSCALTFSQNVSEPSNKTKSECYSWEQVYNPEVLQKTKITFAAFEKRPEDGQYFIIIATDLGVFRTDVENTPEGLNPLRDFDNAPRLFITGDREVHLFYYGNGWLRARKYYVKPIPGNVGSADLYSNDDFEDHPYIKLVGTYFSTRVLTYNMKNFGESGDGRFVDYNECQLMLRRPSAKDDWNLDDKTAVDHDTPFGGCHTMRVLYYTDFQMNADGRHSKCVVPEQQQPTNYSSFYCLGDAPLGTFTMYREIDMGRKSTADKAYERKFRLPYHGKRYCNTFEDVKIEGGVTYLNNGVKSTATYKLVIHQNDEGISISPYKSPDAEDQTICVYMPEGIRFGVVWDAKWEEKSECQPIRFEEATVAEVERVEAAQRPVYIPTCKKVKESILSSIPLFATSCVLAVIITFCFISVVTLERSKSRKRKGPKGRNFKTGETTDVTTITTVASEYTRG